MIKSVLFYTVSIIFFVCLSMSLGTELLGNYAKYGLHVEGLEPGGYSEQLTFGIFMFLGWILEFIIGVVLGCLMGKKLNSLFNS